MILAFTLSKPSKDLRAGMIDAEVHAARIEERSYFELRAKEFAITYKNDRNVIESMNAFARDSGKENLGASQNRRLRGMAA